MFKISIIVVQQMFVLQKRALRTMLKLHYIEHCKDYFKLHEILPLPCLYILDCVTFVKKHPDIFRHEQKVHSYETRNINQKIKLPKTRLKLVDNGPYCKCIVLYNKLPEFYKMLNNLSFFKSEVKKLLLRHCFYSVKEYLAFNFD